LALKKALLTTLYEVYERLAARFPVACRRECSACCTHNVLATSLESELIMSFLEETGREDLMGRLIQPPVKKRLQATFTINGVAEYCLRKENPPEEVLDFQPGPCPLREPDGCHIYPVRPFGCRSLWSRVLCKGEAVMDPLLITLNLVFQQIIEQIDHGGIYGNMLDVVEALGDAERRNAYRLGLALSASPHLPANRPNPGFLVPSEHRREVVHALNTLWKEDVEGLSFRTGLDSFGRSWEEPDPRPGQSKRQETDTTT